MHKKNVSILFYIVGLSDIFVMEIIVFSTN